MINKLKEELKNIDVKSFPKFDNFDELLKHIESELINAVIKANKNN